ncbi:pantoate--beta-alanine ligase, partial [Mycobacterium avium]
MVRRARQECDFVAVFWNGALSLEWADGALQSYARNLERDSALFEQAAADLVSAP